MLSAGILSHVIGVLINEHFNGSFVAQLIGCVLTACGVSMMIHGEFSYRRRIEYLENDIDEIRKEIR